MALHQAVALSCSIDPRTPLLETGYGTGDFPDRWSTARNHIHAGSLKPSRILASYGMGPDEYRFTLPKFAAFARDRGWPLPDEYPKPESIPVLAPAPTPEPSTRKPLTTKERDSLLVIIDALAKLAGVDLDIPHAAAAVIVTEATKQGLKITDNTVVTALKGLPEARRRRGT